MDDENQMKENNKNDTTTTKDPSVLCLAVVRKESSDVVVFDAQGEPKSFSYKNLIATTPATRAGVKKLCFSTHGYDTDDLLTPCFDEEGNHGEPEESCFCGIDEPHIHAHWHDPDWCVEDENDSNAGNGGGCQAGKNKKSALQTEDALMKLAKLTLVPVEDEERMALMSLPVSDHMPNQCNGGELLNSLAKKGHRESSWKNRRRMHKVQVRKLQLGAIQKLSFVDFLFLSGPNYDVYPARRLYLISGFDTLHKILNYSTMTILII